MACLDGYTLHLTSHPPQPSIGFTYSAGTRTLSRSSSAVLSSSTSLKRKRSEDSMSVTITVAKSAPAPNAPLILPIVFPSVNPEDDYEAPPSPAPTEIIDDPNSKTGEECMQEAKAAGVKVRDFAHEPLPKARDPRAPELWNNPREALVLHDRYIRVGTYRAAHFRLSGKLLHRLLASNWVTQKEAEANWRPEDWHAVSEYIGRPLGPYPFCIPKSLKKPTAAYRAYMLKEMFFPMPGDIPESRIYVPPDEPDMDDGPLRVEPDLYRAAAAILERPQSNGVSAPKHTDTPGGADPVHADKRRRVSDAPSAAGAAATPSSTPPASPTLRAARTLSRNPSSSAPTPPRASTPPAATLPPLTRPARGRGRGLARTQTFATIA
ncbi:hypothetical protein FKP32DRAFT_1595162 [Trametes sanguinea]|nr:hypothetical protein FKP32DRAFT_1595162 [Trametes sanguinea]